MTEEQLAEKVVAWLQDQEWDVYQEVTCTGSVCDIVATRVGVVWAIECKTTLSLSVIGQAFNWTRLAHYSSVAVPAPKKRRDPFSIKVLRDYGIGMLEVSTADWDRDYVDPVSQIVRPILNRRIGSLLGDALRIEHKTWAKAGNSSGKRFTPFQRTRELVQRHVSKRAPMLLKDLISELDHHYATDASARNSLRQLIDRGVIQGVRIRRDGPKVWVDAV